jgi:hypothetical protein
MSSSEPAGAATSGSVERTKRYRYFDGAADLHHSNGREDLADTAI